MIVKALCEWKGVNIITTEGCPMCIHMLVEISPKMTVVDFMAFFERKRVIS